MKLLEDWKGLLTTNCECNYLDADTDTWYKPEYCDGSCYEDARDCTLELIEEWLKRNDYPDAAMIQGVAMTWQRLSGYALIRQAGTQDMAREILTKLMLNADFTLELKLTGRACHVVRYSHDEPTGASFELHKFTACDGWSECQATEGITEYEGANYCAWCLDLELANN